jgi:hypothetical protein
VVLHALQKSPEERPVDAAAFRHELFEIVERLGLAESAAASGFTLVQALRKVGTESPSGQLVIDPARLGALSASALGDDLAGSDPELTAQRAESDLPLINPKPAPEKREFPQIEIALDGLNRETGTGKRGFWIVVACFVLLLVGAGYWAAHYKGEADRSRSEAVQLSLEVSNMRAEKERLAQNLKQSAVDSQSERKNFTLETEKLRKDIKRLQTETDKPRGENEQLKLDKEKLTNQIAALDEQVRKLTTKIANLTRLNDNQAREIRNLRKPRRNVTNLNSNRRRRAFRRD